jgi:hypothetical protein
MSMKVSGNYAASNGRNSFAERQAIGTDQSDLPPRSTHSIRPLAQRFV